MFCYFKVTFDDVGQLSITRRDIGMWCVLVCGCTHMRRTEQEAKTLLESLRTA